jgi:hypothetical protein
MANFQMLEYILFARAAPFARYTLSVEMFLVTFPTSVRLCNLHLSSNANVF